MVGHPVIFLSLSGEENHGFVSESNLFLFSLAMGFPFAHGLCPFFRGAFTGEVLHDACMNGNEPPSELQAVQPTLKNYLK